MRHSTSFNPYDPQPDPSYRFRVTCHVALSSFFSSAEQPPRIAPRSLCLAIASIHLSFAIHRSLSQRSTLVFVEPRHSRHCSSPRIPSLLSSACHTSHRHPGSLTCHTDLPSPPAACIISSPHPPSASTHPTAHCRRTPVISISYHPDAHPCLWLIVHFRLPPLIPLLQVHLLSSILNPLASSPATDHRFTLGHVIGLRITRAFLDPWRSTAPPAHPVPAYLTTASSAALHQLF